MDGVPEGRRSALAFVSSFDRDSDASAANIWDSCFNPHCFPLSVILDLEDWVEVLREEDLPPPFANILWDTVF